VCCVRRSSRPSRYARQIVGASEISARALQRTCISRRRTNGLYTDKGEVGGSSPPRPTNKNAAILTSPLSGACSQKAICQLFANFLDSQIPEPPVYPRPLLDLGAFLPNRNEAKTSSNKACRGRTSMGVGLVDSAAVTSPQCEAKSWQHEYDKILLAKRAWNRQTRLIAMKTAFSHKL
jgi:hypothetical protein